MPIYFLGFIFVLILFPLYEFRKFVLILLLQNNMLI